MRSSKRTWLATLATVAISGCHNEVDFNRDDGGPAHATDGGYVTPDAHRDAAVDSFPLDVPPNPPADAAIAVRHPDWGPTVRQTSAPPPLSGGTLLVARDGHTAVAADPERDRVVVVDLSNPFDTTPIALTTGDEPGRLAEDGAGRVHVALRGAHALATIDLATRAVVTRRDVCPEPRGVAYDPATDLVHVACVGGELVSLPAAGGAPTRALNLGPDLRDVVVQGDTLWVSTFRAADVLRLGADGQVTTRTHLERGASSLLDPEVAWRVVARPGNVGVLVLHQAASHAEIAPDPGGYGMEQDRIVSTAFTSLAGDGSPTPGFLVAADITLGIDVAFSPDGTRAVVAAPGEWKLGAGPQVAAYLTTQLNQNGIIVRQTTPLAQPQGQAIAVAFDGAGHVVVQTREPSALFIADLGTDIPLGGESREDTGHTLFHSDPGGGLACASCHPEGRDDGHVWTFRGIGPRRTQYLRGGLLATAPFHWSGEFGTMGALAHDVFTGRMSGGDLAADQVDALAHWLDAVPRLAASAPADAAAVARGDALFHDATVGCAGCHAGPALTNNATVDVGTGGTFQVPSLRNVALHAPYMHNGCGSTLYDRFAPTCGGAAHGNTAALTDAQRADLVAYLQTL